MTPRIGFWCYAWPYKSFSWIYIIIFYSIDIHHIDSHCVKGLWCCLYTYLIVDFHLFYHGAVDIHVQIWALTRSRCKVSDTQVTGKACRPIVFKEFKNLSYNYTAITIQNLSLSNNYCIYFTSRGLEAQVSISNRLSVCIFFTFHLLLQNHRANFNQTWH